MRIFYVTNIPWKRSHKKRKMNCNKEKYSETEMNEISEGKEVGEVEIDERVKDKKSKAL